MAHGTLGELGDGEACDECGLPVEICREADETAEAVNEAIKQGGA
jgi:hypothetical protein